ncbi:alpha-glucosidase/alpha-galactosidase [Paenibacillus pasadenensis]|uniref:alpha-glucosidase/alpha-galactosidase n=1 Tax=Paenibacillus pasadenensis TaxID=217090 RepID=UPI00203DB86A|nr:alpha-glucosidase/alpha-galactosidase [Paenibacillus pasadenensis]MCM3747098.1 alpha-glucosidase/alpha-galactosidase [Paenibacillus pasadenensis]
MSKITFLGAGSTVFARNVLGDVLLTSALQSFEIALFDIDHKRVRESEQLLNAIKRTSGSTCTIKVYEDRKEALRGAKYIINAIQVGGYEPCTVTDFEIPKKYGLRQTIADTIGIGGIFRNLRTIPVLEGFAQDIREVCPDALFMNYTNPMAVLTNYMNTYAGVNTVGLCHSVQHCVSNLFDNLGIDKSGVKSKIAGINHMAWLLEVTRDGVDLYPEIKRLAAEKQKEKHWDMVRLELMLKFGAYVTESSEHNAEYHPYFIKRNYPELIERFNIPLDEYPRRCVDQIDRWNKVRDDLLSKAEISHKRTEEYASYIMEAIETNIPYKIGGNVMNTGGLISNLPREACVEVPCLVDRSGIQPVHIGNLPPQLAALNRTNINTQLLTLEAAVTRRKEHIYHAAMLDPHTAAELSIDDIVSLCDDLIEAHGDWLPKYN